MGVQAIDGFDKYGPIGLGTTAALGGGLATAMQNEWLNLTTNGTNLFALLVVGLNGTGQALKFNHTNNSGLNRGYLERTFIGGAQSRLIGGIRANVVTINCEAPVLIQGYQTGTAQFSITVDRTLGSISIRTGDYNGTVLQACVLPNVRAGSTHHFEWDVTVGATGAYQVWMDGVSILSGTGNTRGDATNNTATTIRIGCGSSTQQGDIVIYDDPYLFDASGSFNNAVLNTDPKVDTKFPSSDSQTQFTNTAGVMGSATTITSTTNAPGANFLFLVRYIPEVTQSLASVSCIPQTTAAGANTRAVVYPDSAGSPNGLTLTASGTQVTGTTAGTVLTCPFGSPPSLTGGTAYWIGLMTDTSVALNLLDATTVGLKAAATYASGAPATCPTMTTAQTTWEIWGNLTGATTNWSASNDNWLPGDLSYALANVAAKEDLYGFPALSGTPTTIYTVALKSFGKKTDVSNGLFVDLRMKSSATESAGSNAGIQPDNVAYGFLVSFFDRDPNGAIAWTAANLNSATAGPRLATVTTPSGTQLNPSDKSATITLSNSNVTATAASTGADTGVRTVASKSSGSYYFEFKWTQTGSDNGAGIALAGATFPGLGTSAASGVIFFTGGNLWINSSNTGACNIGQNIGDWVGMAFTQGGNVWVRNATQGGGWYGALLTAQNPATNTGGRSIAGLVGALFGACVITSSTTGAFTFNFGDSPFKSAPPAGFTAGIPP